MSQPARRLNTRRWPVDCPTCGSTRGRYCEPLDDSLERYERGRLSVGEHAARRRLREAYEAEQRVRQPRA